MCDGDVLTPLKHQYYWALETGMTENYSGREGHGCVTDERNTVSDSTVSNLTVSDSNVSNLDMPISI